jgi:predicted GNAT superfamily acetyltransferase
MTIPPTETAGIAVRDVRVDEMRDCQALQRRAWGIVEDGYVVPVATMAAAQKMGGLVLGAFRGATLVGFAFAFLGRLPDGSLSLHSQLAAVDPDLQGSGIGRLLKAEQRRRARALGLAQVSWTFDPLQAANAAFNLGVLGAIGRAYEPDLYGARSDALNAGLATDRLLAVWSTIGDARSGPRERWPDGLELIAASDPQGAVPRVRGVAAPAGARLHLAIPPAIKALKAADVAAARAWQDAVRASFTAAFALGYVATGFAKGDGLPCYLLEAADG